MRKIVGAVACGFLFCSYASAMSCKRLTQLHLRGTIITHADIISSLSSAKDLSITKALPAFCRVAVILAPSPDSDIRMQIWMPVSGWNGKLEGTGNGGYAGSIDYRELAAGLRSGYAVANSDMGTAPSSSMNADVLIGHSQKWIDWGWRSTHDMTIAAKLIIKAYYRQAPYKSYFVGCSTGGEQGLMEAQRFPDDYDGIVAGAPANDRTRLHMDILWNFEVLNKQQDYGIPPGKLQMITDVALRACANLKVVRSDAFFSIDPYDCHWNPASIICRSGESNNCLTADQVESVNKIYRGPIDPVTHQLLYPGLPPGSESGWRSLVLSDGGPPYASLFRWVFGPNWNWRIFNYSSDVTSVDARLASMLNAINPNLSAFKSRGGKLIMYHGWADWLVSPQESIDYYDAVADTQGGIARAHHETKYEETGDFLRLFMVPGMAHCSGGPGLDSINALPALDLWVEKGIPPKQIIAARVSGNNRVMARPVCPYPEVPRYHGVGATTVAAHFSCFSPVSTGVRLRH